MKNLEGLYMAESLRIAGIEPGNISGKAGAVVAQLEGSGDSTVCDLMYYTCRSMPDELAGMLKSAAGNNSLDAEELAGINFLFLHHLSSLYGQLFEETDLSGEDIDLVGLKCMEVGGKDYPLDPADFSEMIGNIVISRFSIGMGDSDFSTLPLEESIFRTLVAEMIQESDFEDEAYEAIGVALLANESFRNHSWKFEGKRRVDSGSGREKVVFNGEFYLPSR
ncbi:MAG: hypothetical protein R6U43_09785 [Candidatus Krumholzibacteriales bacterium]